MVGCCVLKCKNVLSGGMGVSDRVKHSCLSLAATVLEGSFTLTSANYLAQFSSPDSSPEGVALTTSLEGVIEKEMFQFGLTGQYEADVLSLNNR